MARARSAWPFLALALGTFAIYRWRPHGGSGAPPVPRPASAEAPVARASSGETRSVEEALAEEPTRVAVSEQPKAELEPDTLVLNVVVRDLATELPLGGARLAAPGEGAAARATTDAEGRCVLPVRAEQSPLRLEVEREGYFHIRADYERRDLLELRLARSGVLHGRILEEESGRPVPGVRIELEHGGCRGCAPGLATSDASGHYELAGAPIGEGRAVLNLAAEGFPEQSAYRSWQALEGPVELDLSLTHGIELRGRVIDLRSGEGLSGALVGRIVAEEDGRFHGPLLLEPEADSLHLRVEAAGHVACSYRIPRADLATALELRLPLAASLEGLVQDERGAAIAGAQVRILVHSIAKESRRVRGEPQPPTPLDDLPPGWTCSASSVGLSAKTDASGAFRLQQLPSYEPDLFVGVTREGYAATSKMLERMLEPGETVRLNLVLPSSRTVHVRGSVRLNGEPLRTGNGRLSWRGADEQGETTVELGDFEFRTEAREVSGEVALEGLPAELEGSRFHVQLGEASEQPLALDLRLPQATIGGRVCFEEGAPGIGAIVTASCRLRGDGDKWTEQLQRSVTVEADGSFAVQVVDWERPYRVEARLPNQLAAAEDVAAGTAGLALTLERPAALLVRAVDAFTRRPLRLPVLQWRGPRDAAFREFERESYPDSEGWLAARLPTGTYDLRAIDLVGSCKPGIVEGIRISLDGGPPRVEIELEPGLELGLELEPGSAPPGKSWRVFLLEEDAWESVAYDEELDSWDGGSLGEAIERRTLLFGPDGRTRLSGLAPGRYRIKVFPPELAFQPETIELPPEGREPVLLRWRWSR